MRCWRVVPIGQPLTEVGQLGPPAHSPTDLGGQRPDVGGRTDRLAVRSHGGFGLSAPKPDARLFDLSSQVVTDIPDRLIKLECAAETARAKLAGLTGDEYDVQWEAWRRASEEFQAAVTEFAKRDDVTMSRYEVEQAAKKAVRHAQEDPAVE